ncbi:MAG: hypothetical protein AAGA73_05775 [Pseudomonadota bacterium]
MDGWSEAFGSSRVLGQTAFARLFAAQILALTGMFLLTIVLGHLAYDLLEERATVVLGMACAIKMVAYVALPPISMAIFQSQPRESDLGGMDVVRAAITLFLPFIGTVWQIYRHV